MRGAAVNLKKVALELGGKSPNIVFDDADFETAVDNALTAAFTHSGQVCSAGCRAIVQDDDLRPLRRGARPARRPDPAGARARRRDRGRRAHLGRAPGQGRGPRRERPSPRARGWSPAAGGPTEPELQAGFFYRPTVFADVTARRCGSSARRSSDRSSTVERFTTEDEAIALGNDTTYGLAGAVWTADAGRAQRVAARLRHGTVWINDYNTYLPQAEWGGFKQSGIGRELGPSGLDEYREAKHIWQNTAPGPTGWFGG